MRAIVALEILAAVALFAWGRIEAGRASTPTQAIEAGTLYTAAAFMAAVTVATVAAWFIAGHHA